MLKAAEDVAKAVAGNDGTTKIGESVDNGAGANADSVKRIATGMKGIVDAAKEGGAKFEPADVDNVDNKEAGKLFGAAAGGDAAAGDVAKVVAGNDGTKIGESVANGAGADADSVKGIATGMKGIIDAAKEGGAKFEPAAVVNDNVDNKEAGKLFGAGAGGGAVANDVAKAAAAVGVVSGEQILKAIATAADDTTNHGGKRGNAAENAIQAAIGNNQQGGEDFTVDKMGKKNDQIAAALVLRGMAKNGKFSVNGDDPQKTAKSTVESAVSKTAT